jgi:hypothetical protein
MDDLTKRKLDKLLEIEGYESVEELMEAVFSDSVSPTICMNEDCDFTCEMEPDQDAGYCGECHTNTMKRRLEKHDHAVGVLVYLILESKGSRFTMSDATIVGALCV